MHYLPAAGATWTAGTLWLIYIFIFSELAIDRHSPTDNSPMATPNTLRVSE
jgi:hypothetical protein